MRSNCILPFVLLALVSCSSPSPSSPGPTPSPTPAPTPTPQAALPFEGRYELVIAIASDCRDQFPDSLRNKVYSIRLTTAGNGSLIAFDNPDVVRGMNDITVGFVTQLEGRDWVTLRLFFGEEFVNSMGVHERYSVGGSAQGFLDRDRAEGHFFGQVSYSGTSLGPYAICMSGAHDFLLRPI